MREDQGINEGTLQEGSSRMQAGVDARSTTVAELWQNLKYGGRLLRLNPGFAAVMILSLALGIGANTAIFQLINAVRLRSLPVSKPEELAIIKIVKSPQGRSGMFAGYNAHLTYPVWEKIREQKQGFAPIGVML